MVKSTINAHSTCKLHETNRWCWHHRWKALFCASELSDGAELTEERQSCHPSQLIIQ